MGEELTDRLVSPNGFDGNGPVPELLRDTAKRAARLRVRWMLHGSLTDDEIGEVFDASMLQAEWMRELYEARDALRSRITELERERDYWHLTRFAPEY